MPVNVLCDLPLAASGLKEDKGNIETIKEYHTNKRIGQEISSQWIYVLDFFYSFTVRLDTIKVFYLPTDAQ